MHLILIFLTKENLEVLRFSISNSVFCPFSKASFLCLPHSYVHSDTLQALAYKCLS